jgi:hypothetical protein
MILKIKQFDVKHCGKSGKFIIFIHKLQTILS